MKKVINFAIMCAAMFVFCGCMCTSDKKAEVKTAPVKKAGSAVKEATPASKYRVTIHLVGDSTCAYYPVGRSPLTGWGQVLKEFCKGDVRVNNQAYSGYSSTSYIYSKRWERLIDMVSPGDYVIIQFGHNDEKKGPRHADVKTTYPANLKKFITEVRAKKANPVIATSISRCVFRKGRIASSGLDRYREAAITVAKAENVPVIDLKNITAEKFNKMGETKAFALFRGRYTERPRKKVAVKPVAQTVSPAQIAIANNNSPAAAEKIISPGSVQKVDRTHLVRHGALEVAGWFVNDCKAQKMPLAECFK